MPMQPRPRTDTVSAASPDPRMRVASRSVVDVVMAPPSALERAPSQGLPAGARLAAQPLLVDADLVVDRAEVFGDLGQLSQHPVPVLVEQVQPGELVAVALPAQLGVLPDGADWHPGRPQPGDQQDPAEVVLGVAAVPPPGPAGGLGPQPAPLLVAPG